MPRAALHLIVLLTALALSATACTPPSPEEQVASVRGQYTAELVSFRVEQIPQETEEESAEASLEEASEEGSAAGDGDIVVEVPDHLAANLINNLYFDILVSTSADDPLATLTVDLTHASITQEEKAVYRLPLDVTGVVKGSGEQITATLENVEDFEDGDLFAVEIRSSVDEAERAEYPEFSG